MLSRQRTRPVTCSTRSRRIVSGSDASAAVTLASTGTASGRMVTFGQRLAHARRRRAASAGNGTARTRTSGMARLMPLALAISAARSIASFDAGDHHLARRIVVGDDADAALGRGFLRHGFGGFDLGADQRGHRALAHRHGGLHRLAARFQKPRRIGQAEGARGAQRGIFAQRMAGDQARMPGEIEAAFLLQHADDGDSWPP